MEGIYSSGNTGFEMLLCIWKVEKVSGRHRVKRCHGLLVEFQVECKLFIKRYVKKDKILWRDG